MLSPAIAPLTRTLLRHRAPQLYTAFIRNPSTVSSVSSSSFPILSSHTTSTPSHKHKFHTSTARSMASSSDFLSAVENRRSIYPLTSESPISDARIEEIVKHAVLHVPSSFNSQSTRIVLLLNEEHQQFWEFVKEVLKPQVPEDQFSKTEQKLDGFKAGHGTVLFLNDPAPVNDLMQKFAMYAQHFPGWATQSNAMHQYHLWTALEAEGLGANLQHYNPIIDQKAKTHWNIPQEWELQAQLVFGTPAEGAREKLGEKNQQPIGERLFVHGAKN